MHNPEKVNEVLLLSFMPPLMLLSQQGPGLEFLLLVFIASRIPSLLPEEELRSHDPLIQTSEKLGRSGPEGTAVLKGTGVGPPDAELTWLQS